MTATGAFIVSDTFIVSDITDTLTTAGAFIVSDTFIVSDITDTLTTAGAFIVPVITDTFIVPADAFIVAVIA
ncbi:MAG: hypothetical protein MPJ53_01010, partial [Alphaproteobacteria bacterium]|nr:hypothetical protein [Alphaproteobacteria bacterium]